MQLWFLVTLLVGLAAAPLPATAADPPVELGAVDWGRDLEAAKKTSAETGKPILVLFQEVPG